MGHVSDFYSMNTYDDTDFRNLSCEFASENIPDFHPNDNLITNSFTQDDSYNQHFYMPLNITFDERNDIFDEPLFDMLLESGNNYNNDLSASDLNLVNGPSILENDPLIALEPSEDEKEESTSHSENEDDVKVPSELQKSKSQTDSFCESNGDETDVYAEVKIYTAETVIKQCDSLDKPNIILKIKYAPVVEKNIVPKSEVEKKVLLKSKVDKVLPEPKVENLVLSKSKVDKHLLPKPKVTEPKFPTAEYSAIADTVKLGRRRTVNVKIDGPKHCSSKKVVDITHKKKSRHKKAKDFVQKIKQEVPDLNQNFKSNSWISPSLEFSTDGKLLQMDKPTSNFGTDNSNASSFSTETVSPCLDVPPLVDTDFFSNHDEHGFNYLSNDTAGFSKNSSTSGKGNEPALTIDAVDAFPFDFEDVNIFSSSLDNPKELTVLDDEFLEQFETSVGDGNIPELSKSLAEDLESMNVVVSSKENSFSSMSVKEEGCSSVKEEHANVVANESSNKGSCASELIDELHAHNQQVFEEIEVSTPDLELDLCGSKPSIQIVHPVTSHQVQYCANNNTSEQSVSVTEHVENDMNSQNHLPVVETSVALSNKAAPAHGSATHNGTAIPRKVSSSSSSSTSKSSTSQRCYRKRQISTSSNSSSDGGVYNGQVKYDPSTRTYCDEFGREIRQSQLKYYLNSKGQRDSHSNNGSSRSTHSRSKSPKRQSHHRKHHKSRSNSGSHKKRRRSPSRSRSRSHGRKHKDEVDRKYRSPSPKQHGRKPHYMDLAENIKANEERRVMYVGDIPYWYTIEQLRERFGQFGPIQDATIKSKLTNESSPYIFGFVTYKNRSDACQAIERGNDNPAWPRFDLNFGGRRRFCTGDYTDLDGKVAEDESGWYSYQPLYHRQPVKKEEDEFTELLKQEQRRLGMSKK